MKTYKQLDGMIKEHEVAKDIIEGIIRFKRRIEWRMADINAYEEFSRRLADKYRHDVEIYDACIKRLWERYNRCMERMTSE